MSNGVLLLLLCHMSSAVGGFVWLLSPIALMFHVSLTRIRCCFVFLCPSWLTQGRKGGVLGEMYRTAR